MKLASTILFVIVVASGMGAQTPLKEQKFTPAKDDPLAKPIADPVEEFLHPACIKLPESVSVRGLRLGDSLVSVQRRFPSLHSHKAVNGDNALSISVKPGLPRPSEINGIAILTVEFSKGQAISITAAYEPDAIWENREQFRDEVAKRFGLPASDHWLDYRSMSSFRCENGGISVGFEDRFPVIIIMNDKLANALSDQKAAAAREAIERKRAQFKP